jgi:hypothetical protein
MTEAQILAIVIVVAVAVVAVVAFLFSRKRRSERLREHFGPEYDRVLRQEGDARKAEGVLEFREKRRQQFTIRPLAATDRSMFAARWTQVQAQFVDDPGGAVAVADALVTEVLQLRGYPISEFEQRAADISVDYPLVVQNYRAAHAIAMRHGAGQVTTEDLRQAMVHYRALFQELLEEQTIEKRIVKKPTLDRRGA